MMPKNVYNAAHSIVVVVAAVVVAAVVAAAAVAVVVVAVVVYAFVYPISNKPTKKFIPWQ